MRSATKRKNLLREYPDAAKYWHPTKNLPLTPDKVLPGSMLKVWFFCRRCRKPYQTPIYVWVKTKGCRECFITHGTGGKTFAKKYPFLVAEWDYEKNKPLTPDTISASSAKKVWWKCAKGHEWRISPAHRNLSSTQCPVCRKELAKDRRENPGIWAKMRRTKRWAAI
jgi:hypothetical protein